MPDSNLSKMNGPLPTVRRVTSPSCSTTSLGRIQKIGLPIWASNGAYASFNVNWTVRASVADTLETWLKVLLWGETCMKRSKDQATSWAVTGRPFIGGRLCQVAFGRKVKVHVLPSSLGFHDSARSPSMMYA